MFFVFLLSGLFLGWSLGANDAANVYGTAVGTRMIRFRTAAIVCSAMVIVGAVLGGAGAAHTLGSLGAVNALPGSFTVALAAAVTVTWMTRLSLPVSTSQAIVGAIIGWNLFSGSLTNWGSLTRIFTSWVLCPILAGLFAMALHSVAAAVIGHSRIHLFRLDRATRIGLLIVGAFASYSLGANNIANVVGVFVGSSPLSNFDLPGHLVISGPQQLFLLGALAIALGVFTYSKKVMLTVGNDLFRLSPISALIVVLAQAIVLFLFASEGLENWLVRHGLPSIPLVPVSSSQAVIGAVLGIGIAKGGRNIHFRVLGRIASGWVSTPIIAAGVAFVSLFVVQNVFSQQVARPVRYEITAEVAGELAEHDLYQDGMDALLNQEYDNAAAYTRALSEVSEGHLAAAEIARYSQVHPLLVDIEKLHQHWNQRWYSPEQLLAVFRLHGRTFRYDWELDHALAELSPDWVRQPPTRENKLYNKGIDERLTYLHDLFAVQ